MKKKLNVGSGLALPLEWATLATVVYGARGSGKTCFGRRVAEEAHRLGQRFCAVDLKGDWYGLKSSADGKSAGLPVVIFGGDHADLPLEDGAGAFVAETVAGIAQSTVLDLEHFSKGKQVRFLAAFFDKLYDANRDNLLLLLDESQRYAPQARMMDPDSAKCLGAVEDLVKLGRKHGIGPVLFTQRGSGLNKEVSELCDMMVAFRTPGPLDQGRVKDWLDANTTKAQRDEVMGKLSGLPTGTAVFASGHPDLKVFGVYAVDRPETFDSSATPKPGQRRVVPKKLAEPDLVELRTKMAATIERAKADDPRELRKQIAELKRQLSAQGKQVEVQRVEVPVFDEAELNALQGVCRTELSNLSGALSTAQSVIAEAIRDARKHCVALGERGVSKPKRHPGLNRYTRQARAETKSNNAPNGSSQLKTMHRAMLTALAQHPDGLTKRQVLIHTGYASSGPVSTAFADLVREGYVEGDGNRLAITRGGLKVLGPFEPLPLGDDLREWLLESDKLNRMERSLLSAICAAYPSAISKGDVLQKAEYASSGPVSTAFAKLVAYGYAVPQGAAMLRAAAELFS